MTAFNPDLQSKDWPRPQPRPHWASVWRSQPKRAVLFDLDGTLLDTAADLGAVANSLRADKGLPPMPLEELRPYTSQGARGMIFKGLGVGVEHPEYQPLRDRFLERYAQAVCVHTQFMPGLEAIVDALDEQDIPWGIVTNKFERFTHPLIEAMGLHPRLAALVSGDTTPHAKPHPAPMHHAFERLGLPAQAVTYIGDDFRDIQSGYNAGCFTIAVNFGFGCVGQPVEDWGADAIVQDAQSLSTLLLQDASRA